MIKNKLLTTTTMTVMAVLVSICSIIGNSSCGPILSKTRINNTHALLLSSMGIDGDENKEKKIIDVSSLNISSHEQALVLEWLAKADELHRNGRYLEAQNLAKQSEAVLTLLSNGEAYLPTHYPFESLALSNIGSIDDKSPVGVAISKDGNKFKQSFRQSIIQLGVEQSDIDRIHTLKNKGAYTCAPKNFARVIAHFEFFILSNKFANHKRAEEHYNIFTKNFEDANAKSKAQFCQNPKVNNASGVLLDIDVDKDGIEDSVDKCLGEKEDYDGFEDHDGCDDKDNDEDGILDHKDDCPNTPGTKVLNGCLSDEPKVLDKDKDGVIDSEDSCPEIAGTKTTNQKGQKGCPEKIYVKVDKEKIVIKEQIKFEPNTAKITGSVSQVILDQIASIMTSHTEYTVAIEGHTDSKGSSHRNLNLSKARALAVMNALTQRGIPAKKLSAEGYGEDLPRDTNDTVQGRANNRRVEFKIRTTEF